jgi:predicted DNA-binding ribbon-helix-helix protein
MELEEEDVGVEEELELEDDVRDELEELEELEELLVREELEELAGALDAAELAALEAGVELATEEVDELDGGAEELDELASALMVCVSDVLVHVLKLEFPLYTAVSTCAPTVSVVTSRYAEPLTIAAVPTVVDPSRKVTVPVALVGATVPVRRTESPSVAGFKEDPSAMVQLALFTV